MPYLLLFVVGMITWGTSPRSAAADAQLSIRNSFELGQRRAGDHDELIWGGGLRGDAMFGWARPKSFRVGPAFELRTTEFRTIEGALGAGVLIPLPGDLPIGLTGLLGSALRKGDRPDGLVGIGTATWGFRGYNYHSWYGYALNLFFSGRKDLGEDHVELTGGIEIDIVFTTVIPGRAIAQFLRSGDPYEE